ncbi:MAG TPA: hypothetical protein VJ890_28195 [Vineibacter sp.]|nr:hypothetical protein [Vineibacter sp.]
MPLAVREQILAALFARLGDRLGLRGDGQDDVPLRRNPSAAQEQLTAVDLYDGGHDIEVGSTTRDSAYILGAELELFAPDGPAFNELYARVRAAIDLDRTFGGLANNAKERSLTQPSPGTTAGHPDVLGAVLTLDVEFWTRDDDVRAQ